MAPKKSSRGLGKGLDSLIPVKEVEEPKSSNKKSDDNVKDGNTIYVDINKVEPNPDQPRKDFDPDALQDLSDSIKEKGVLAPLWVHEVEKNKKKYYEIIAGERRWRASKEAGLKELPVIVMDLSEQEIVEISLIENIQREDLNPIEEALAYKRLLDEFNLKQDDVAKRVSKSRVAITNSMRLLKLDDRVQQLVIDKIIPTGSARALLSLDDKDKQYEFAQRILDEKMTVRDVEREIKKFQNEKNNPDKATKNEIDPKLLVIYNEFQEKLKSVLGTKVTINPKDNRRGKIEIEYYNQDELDRIIDMLMEAKAE
ncbi:MAG: ParB/RepB/Spo0J family partition protein [Lachnospiraceae bacterium]|nr:ParB/RepB/Spo0J family partition protein [Lachnospiraceae bacterium]